MARTLFALLFLGLFLPESFSQDKNIDARAASIPASHTVSVDALASYIQKNFSADSDRVRAIYVWITHHIRYDVPRLKERDKNPFGPPQAVADVLSSRYAVCQGYSDLFVSLCKEVGVDAIVVTGYTRSQGKVSPIGHAWVAARLGEEWQLFDPTWGAGYVKDEGFVRQFNNGFYRVPPTRMIHDHMPFDPMYQLLSQPLTHKEFIEGRPAGNQMVFQFADSLKQHHSLSPVQQMTAELRRLERAGVQLDLLLAHQVYLRKSIQSFATQDGFEEGGKAFHAAVDLFKKYIGHKNKQFTTITDNELRQMVDSMSQFVKLSRTHLSSAVPKTDAQRQAIAGNISNIERLWTQVNKEKQFIDQYIALDPAGRRQLFTRR